MKRLFERMNDHSDPMAYPLSALFIAILLLTAIIVIPPVAYYVCSWCKWWEPVFMYSYK